MKVLNAKQLVQADKAALEAQDIESFQLMERAASLMFDSLINKLNPTQPIAIFCGQGNNGGDGLVLARLFQEANFDVRLYLLKYGATDSPDFEYHFNRLPNLKSNEILSQESFPVLDENEVIIDAVLGTGLNKGLEGLLLDLINHLNNQSNYKIAVDIPTGMFADSQEQNSSALRVDYCYTFQAPKQNFLRLPSLLYIEDFEVIDIGIPSQYWDSQESKSIYVEAEDLFSIYKKRQRHSAKWTYGHGLLIAGSSSSAGAAIMAAQSCMRSGVGLLTVQIPNSLKAVLNNTLAEAMLIADSKEDYISEYKAQGRFKAIAFGPGVGERKETVEVLKNIVSQTKVPLILDADALNMLADNQTILNFLNQGTILTPHIGELCRLMNWDKLPLDYEEKVSEFAIKHGIYVLFKSSISCLFDPKGRRFYLNFGGASLAKAGSGDALTGILLALLSNSYSKIEAVCLACFIQGYTAQKLLNTFSEESILASDISNHLGIAFKALRSKLLE